VPGWWFTGESDQIPSEYTIICCQLVPQSGPDDVAALSGLRNYTLLFKQ